MTWAVLALLPLLAWEASGLDRVIAGWSGDVTGFALRENWWLSAVLHEGARRLAWALALLLCLGVWWPLGPLRRIDLKARLQLAVGVLASVFAVSLLKGLSGASCPWDQAEFGGVVPPLSHWIAFLHPDGGGGHCFPAGHASSGFAFVSGWFALRRPLPRLAAVWLAIALSAGFVLGIAQQMRGAHFMSHTLWTLWVCWCVGGLVDMLWRSRSPRPAFP